MNEIDWSKTPEGTVSLNQECGHAGELLWIDGDGRFWDGIQGKWVVNRKNVPSRVIATRPEQPRKTLKDVLEAFPDGCPSNNYIGFGYNEENDVIFVYYDQYGFCNKYEYQVCTREEFEKAYAESKEEWTHIDKNGFKCKKHLKLTGNGGWVFVDEDGRFFVPGEMGYIDVKELKPKITKAEAWDMVCIGETFDSINDKYEVEG